MNQKKLRHFLSFTILLIFSIVIYGCRDEVVNPPVNAVTSEGAYLLSEGGFSPGQSKLSFYNLTNSNFTQNIFNPTTLGLFPDGLILHNNQLYLTEQGNFGSAGKIYILDTNGTVEVASTVGVNPYSLTIANNKLYITNGPTNNVTVITLNNWMITGTINVGLFPQEILSIGNKVFVCNTSVFGGGTDSTVSVIDATTDAVVETIRVRQTPSSLAVTNDGKLLVGCPGDFSNGIIYKIDPITYSKLDSFILSNGFAFGFDKDIAVDKSSNDVYFISYGNNIVKLDLITKGHTIFIGNSNHASTYFNGYNYDSKNKIHYIADAKDFMSSGNLLVYNSGGGLLRTFTAGSFPRRIVIKN